MVYLIIGTIISLAGIGFIISKIKIIGLILLLIGISVGLKGRREIDKNP